MVMPIRMPRWPELMATPGGVGPEIVCSHKPACRVIRFGHFWFPRVEAKGRQILRAGLPDATAMTCGVSCSDRCTEGSRF
uniref:Uncharacterized protein n=1 Tax=Oryza sativa subsp. japonica TaxID=39947 RepID=Q6ZHF9_ORYSJ|nr:hypothetical protein [Oryza sativa Japonica Group]BAD16861.1 hypothetical protein [Oryza sativa Japonica Group]